MKEEKNDTFLDELVAYYERVEQMDEMEARDHPLRTIQIPRTNWDIRQLREESLSRLTRGICQIHRFITPTRTPSWRTEAEILASLCRMIHHYQREVFAPREIRDFRQTKDNELFHTYVKRLCALEFLTMEMKEGGQRHYDLSSYLEHVRKHQSRY